MLFHWPDVAIHTTQAKAKLSVSTRKSYACVNPVFTVSEIIKGSYACPCACVLSENQALHFLLGAGQFVELMCSRVQSFHGNIWAQQIEATWNFQVSPAKRQWQRDRHNFLINPHLKYKYIFHLVTRQTVILFWFQADWIFYLIFCLCFFFFSYQHKGYIQHAATQAAYDRPRRQ